MFSDFDDFELAEGLYYWLQHNHEGQGDLLYVALCVLTAPGVYRPSVNASFQTIALGAKEVYDLLTIENYETAVDQVICGPANEYEEMEDYG